MSWIDPLFALPVAGFAALGASRRLSGAVVGVGGVLALRPLLGVAAAAPVAAIVAALATGLLLGMLGRNLLPRPRRGAVWQRVLGATGGGMLGAAFVLALVTSLPIARSAFDANQLVYPPEDLPILVQEPLEDSWTVTLGRDALLHPLLEAQGVLPEGRSALAGFLHRLFVTGAPWQEGGAGVPTTGRE